MGHGQKTGFDAAMERHVIAWRQRYCSTMAPGWQNKAARAWVLPRRLWEEGLWPPIRKGGRWPLQAHLIDHEITPHTGAHNLKSSWVMCANLYFAFGQCEAGRGLLAQFLAAHIDARIESVASVELEWAGKDALHPAALLGETGGSRGAGQTSPDVAFIVRTGAGEGIVLTESKFTEHSFYDCSARRGPGSLARPANPDRTRCQSVAALPDGHETLCHQSAWGRRYWRELAPVIRREKLAELSLCPAASGAYQLFRQQALAEAVARSGAYAPVISAVAYDARNTSLARALKRAGAGDFAGWGAMFEGKARFGVFTHQAWVDWVGANDDAGEWRAWRTWVLERYDLTAQQAPTVASERNP